MTSPSLHKTIYIGPFVHCVSPTKLEICTTGAIGVDERGVISFIDRNASGSDDPSEAKSYRLSRGGEGVNGSNGHDDGWDEAQIVRIHDLGFFFPGFIGEFSRLFPPLSSLPFSCDLYRYPAEDDETVLSRGTSKTWGCGQGRIDETDTARNRQTRTRTPPNTPTPASSATAPS